MRRRRKARAGDYGSGVRGPALIPVGVPFLCVGAGILIYMFFCWRTFLESASWKSVPARIESVEFKTHSDGDGTTYSVECAYTYEFRGREYRGARVGIMGGADSVYRDHSRRYRILREHKDSGKPYLALVDPECPERAVLFREPRTSMYVLVPFGLVFFGVGAGLIAAGIWWKRKMKRDRELTRELGTRPWLFREDWRDLRVRASTARELAIAWAVGLGMPVFVSMFVIVSLADGLPLFAEVLIWAFAALGVLLFLGAMLVTVRQLFHATPELALTEIPIVPGRKLVAAIQTRKPISADRVDLVLSCTETRAGEKAHRKVLYRKAVAVHPEGTRTDADKTLIPVVTGIPGNLPDSRHWPGHQVAWKLKLKARTFPVSLRVSFDLPVFQADESEIQKRQA